MSETLIKVEDVSKKFCRSLKKSLWYGMQDLGREITGRHHGGDGELRPDEFWAVKDVSFELKRGECLGLIGQNGAGKTTLLKMLNGLIKPDSGRVEMRGRIGALIALGAGFNPILTGRENIYINASVLGLSKREIDEKIDEIIDFSEIGDFIDMPVQSYSSGMNVRLGFSIATTLEPDILLLDEVLAVGDASFRAKCFARIGRLMTNSAVIFVSHDAGQLSRICSSSIYLKRGHLIKKDNTNELLRLYKQECMKNDVDTQTIVKSDEKSIFELKEVVNIGSDPTKIEIHSFIYLPENANVGAILIEFENESGIICQSEARDYPKIIPKGASELKLSIPYLNLTAGSYAIGVNILNESKKYSIIHAKRLQNIVIDGFFGYGCSYNPKSYASMINVK
jgi:lipopolysaccharide transport system ATP-binding protein